MRKALALVLLTGLSAAAFAFATDATSSDDGLLTDPVWKVRVADDELWKFYPDRAFVYGIDGVAMVSCHVGETGKLVNCKVDGEDPKGEEFGPLLSKLASLMQVQRLSSSGVSTTDRTIRIGAQFKHVPRDQDLLGKDRTPNRAIFRSKSVTVELVVVQK